MSFIKVNSMPQPMSNKRESDEFFNRKYRKIVGRDESFNPAFNPVEENENSVQIRLGMESLKKENIEFFVEHDVLTLVGKTTHRHKPGEKQNEKEVIGIPFNFSMILPDGYCADSIQAEVRNKTLYLDIPFDKTANQEVCQEVVE